MAKESGSSRMDTVVKVMLVFFISLLSFSVGTFVGKQVSDSDHRRMALESEFKDGREVASEATPEGPSAKVSEKDVETLTEEFVNKEKTDEKSASGEKSAEGGKAAEGGKEGGEGYKSYAHGEKTAEAKSENKTEAKTEKSEGKEAKEGKEVKESKEAKSETGHEASEKVAKKESAAEGKAEERKPASIPGIASSAVGKFTVQVASYATEEEAKGQAGQLKTKGWNAFYVPAAINGKTWYRVSVGLFNNANSAKTFRTDFVKESNMKTAIVQQIVE